jgi:hypothetical protein
MGGGPRGETLDPFRWPRVATFHLLDRLEMPESSEQDRALLGLCMTRTLARWYDPEPLGGLWPATILKTPARTLKVKRASLATLGGSKSKPTRTRRRF